MFSLTTIVSPCVQQKEQKKQRKAHPCRIPPAVLSCRRVLIGLQETFGMETDKTGDIQARCTRPATPGGSRPAHLWICTAHSTAANALLTVHCLLLCTTAVSALLFAAHHENKSGCGASSPVCVLRHHRQKKQTDRRFCVGVFLTPRFRLTPHGMHTQNCVCCSLFVCHQHFSSHDKNYYCCTSKLLLYMMCNHTQNKDTVVVVVYKMTPTIRNTAVISLLLL